MIPISLCMITKNESDKLDRCLAAVKDLPLEIIVVDTGSTDNSIEVARKYTEHVYHFDWISDFAAARNFSVSKATNDWILVLDTDEYVTSVDMEAIYKLIDENATGVGCLIRTSLIQSAVLLLTMWNVFSTKNFICTKDQFTSRFSPLMKHLQHFVLLIFHYMWITMATSAAKKKWI